MAFIPRLGIYSPSNMGNSSSPFNNSYYCSASGHYNDHTVNTYQCTYYAIARSGEIAGEPVTTYANYPSSPCYRIFNRTGFGDAENWYDDARTKGTWQTSSDYTRPKLGALVIFSSGGWGIAGGHVMVVETINGSYIGMSENQGCFGRANFLRTWHVSELLNHGFIGYIYNPYISEEPSTTVTITASVNPSGAGSVSGTGTYNIGSSVSLTAIAYSGHIFRQWSTGQTTATISFTATENRLYTAYFDDAPIPPTPIEPEEKILTVSPTSKSVLVPQEGTSFQVSITISGTPVNSDWNWYPDYTIGGTGITLTPLSGTASNPWTYSQYTGQDGNSYILTTGTFNVNLEWIKRLGGESGTYRITFTRYNQNWTAYDLTQTLTINYEYVKGDAVLFLQYDGGTVEIR